MTDLFHGDMLPPTAGSGSEPEGESVLVGTASPVPLRVERVEHHLTPEGAACIASYLGGRLIGRCAVPVGTADQFLELDLFRKRVALALNVRQADRVVEGSLLALVPASEVQAELQLKDDDEAEPWKKSVPGSGYSAVSSETGEEEQLVGVFLGQVVRFEEDRRFADSLVREAADMLAAVVRGKIGAVVDRVIQDLETG